MRLLTSCWRSVVVLIQEMPTRAFSNVPSTLHSRAEPHQWHHQRSADHNTKHKSRNRLTHNAVKQCTTSHVNSRRTMIAALLHNKMLYFRITRVSKNTISDYKLSKADPLHACSAYFNCKARISSPCPLTAMPVAESSSNLWKNFNAAASAHPRSFQRVPKPCDATTDSEPCHDDAECRAECSGAAVSIWQLAACSDAALPAHCNSKVLAHMQLRSRCAACDRVVMCKGTHDSRCLLWVRAAHQ